MITEHILKNYRAGVATNSSSTHSIIHNVSRNEIPDTPPAVNNEYDWDEFILSSPEEKAKYLYTQLLANVPQEYYTIMRTAIMGLAGDSSHPLDDMEGVSVNHQSIMTFPYKTIPWSQTRTSINLNFFKEYLDYIVNNNFIILGGNDNQDEHPLYKTDDGQKTSLMDFVSWSKDQETFSNKDNAYKNGNYWVLINSARKMRIKLTEGDTLIPERPELIDIKITDYCDIGCSFCYQNSTAAGKHADTETILELSQHINIEFEGHTEFAIGGGEPTSHPDFAKIVSNMHDNNAIVNFTTKSTKWHSNQEIVEAVYGCVSGVAYSVTNTDDIKSFILSHNKAFRPLHEQDSLLGRQRQKAKVIRGGAAEYLGPLKIYLHIIPEIYTIDEFQEIMNYVDTYNQDLARDYGGRLVVTLLGFKPMGRGENYTPKIDPQIIHTFTNLKNTQVGIDTKMAQDYKEVLEELKIDPKLYTALEGEYSLYVDAVSKKIYKSSWQTDEPHELIEVQPGARKPLYTIRDSFNDIRASNGLEIAPPTETNYYD